MAFDVTGAKWFKLDAAGYDSGRWASENLIDGESTLACVQR